ncbi:DMT family protein [Actinokineospora iranica]|uniref:Magnesium transporter NIPA n=1 Tax=Actinokineospora iranica TaxID=1271860 RepID=A0A1G6XEQ8_9PSEU|nr:hypothetical protein [Actinokineospora iranica]SDD75795.1 hypothetical protein SAMN05216174_11730 [Actinokineospora iranica]
MLGYIELVASTLMYGLGVVAQSVAARRSTTRSGADLGLLVRLASDRLYLLGFAGQVAGFVLAFFARASLPLYLVQAGSSAAVGVAAVFGALVLGWRVRPAEVAVLVMMALGLILLVGASTPSVADDVSGRLGLALLAVLVVGALLIVPASRARSSVPLAVLAGVQFSVVAITSRSLADGSLADLPLDPLAWLLVLSAVAGQASLIFALQRGPATSSVASMDATSVVLASVTGLAVLGDQVAAGRQWWVMLGLALVVLGVLIFGSVLRWASPLTVTEPQEAV